MIQILCKILFFGIAKVHFQFNSSLFHWNSTYFCFSFFRVLLLYLGDFFDFCVHVFTEAYFHLNPPNFICFDREHYFIPSYLSYHFSFLCSLIFVFNFQNMINHNLYHNYHTSYRNFYILYYCYGNYLCCRNDVLLYNCGRVFLRDLCFCKFHFFRCLSDLYFEWYIGWYYGFENCFGYGWSCGC